MFPLLFSENKQIINKILVTIKKRKKLTIINELERPRNRVPQRRKWILYLDFFQEVWRGGMGFIFNQIWLRWRNKAYCEGNGTFSVNFSVFNHILFRNLFLILYVVQG